MCPVLDWSHAVDEIGESGLHLERSATASERESVAEALQIIACEAITARYDIKALAGGRYRLRGTVEAALAQSCVITLDVLETRLDEAFDVEFRPADELSVSAEATVSLENPDLETLEHNRIPVGRIVYEHLAAALDPYPKKEGAAFAWEDESGGPDAASSQSPFSVLSKLKHEP